MRTRSKILLALLGAALLAVGAGLLLGPALIEQAVAARVQRLAATRGLDVTWGALELDGAGATLRDVRIGHRAGRVRAPAVRVELGLWAALTGDARVETLRVERPEAHVALPVPHATDDSPDAIPRAGDAFEMPSGLRGAVIEITDPRLRIERGDHTVDAVAERIALRPGAGGWTLDGAGGAVALDGRPLLAGRIDGSLGPRQITLGLTGHGGPALAWRAGERTLAADAVRLARDADGIEATVEGITAEADGARAEGLRLRARRDADGARLTVEGGALRLDRAALRRLRARLDATDATDAMPADASPSDATPTDAMPGALDPWRLPPDLALAAEGLTVELPGLPPLLEARAAWRDGRLDARAVLAGGEATLAADWTPGHRRPDGLHVELRGVGLAPLFARRLPPRPPARPRRPIRADGALDAALTIAALDGPLGRGPLRIDGHIRWRDGRLDLPGLAETPVEGIDLRLEGHFAWHPGDDRLDFAGRVAQGPLALDGEGHVADLRGDPVVRARATGDPIDCAEAFAAVPSTLWGPYADARLTGRLAPTFALDWPLHRPQTLELRIRRLFEACTVQHLAARAAPPATVDGRPAPGLDDVGWLDSRFVLPVSEGVSDGAEVVVGPGAPGFVPLDQLPRYVGATMYQSEEMNFWRNNAIDRGLLVRALRVDLEHGRFVYGGSTVTQQLVKNLFLTRTKTLARKLQELLVSMRITAAISRHRVLELYVNCIEFGPDVYGIGPAARYYFQKDARDLTPREAVFLAMLKPAPRRGGHYRRRGHGPTHPWWVQRADELMRRLVDGGQISAETAEGERPYHIEWLDRRYVRHPQAPAEPASE